MAGYGFGFRAGVSRLALGAGGGGGGGGGGTVDPSPTTMQSSVTTRGATFPFAVSSPVGFYAAGDPFVVGATVTPTSPPSVQHDGAFDNAVTYTGRWVNGLMSNPGGGGGTGSNPTDTPQGWDTLVYDGGTAPTEFAYSDALNVDPAKTGINLFGEQTLVKAVSLLTSIDSSGRTRISDLAFLTIVDTVPTENSFRRWAGSTDKTPWFTTADLDLTVLPSLAQPGGSTLPTMAAMRAKLGSFQTFMNQQLFARGTVGINQQAQYGGDVANDVMQAMMFTVTAGVSAPDRLEIVTLLVQAGLDFADASENGRRWSSPTYSYGGAHQWMKPLVVYAARLLRNASNATAKAIVNKWADAGVQKVFGSDNMVMPITRTLIETTPYESLLTRLFPVGYLPSMENSIDWLSKPSGTQSSSYAFQMAYRTFNAFPMMASALVARMLGGEALWGNAQFFEYCDRFYNWWLRRGSPTDAYFTAYIRAMVIEYYTDYSPAYLAGAAPTIAKAEARDGYVWLEANEPLDMAEIPAVADFAVNVAGSPVSLATATTTASGVLSTGSTNMSQPVITVASGTGIYVGMRVISGNVPADTMVTSVAGTTIGISSQIPLAFTAQPITFSPISVYGRALTIALPTPLTAGQSVTMSYTAPGSGFARNLRGTALPSRALASVTNRTGELPAAAATRENVYSGDTQSTRQYLGSAAPASEVIRRLQISARFVLSSKTAGDTIIANATGATTNLRLYFATAADLRFLIAGQQFRLPGAGTALPLDKVISAHIVFDFTATTYATIYRAYFSWDGGSHTASSTGSTGLTDGTFAPNIATIFTLGLFMGAIGNGASAMHGALRELIVRYGDATLTQPADFSGAQFAFDADWGGNGESVYGAAPQRYYALTVADANSSAINRGNGGALAMSPRRLTADGEDLLTYYTALVV